MAMTSNQKLSDEKKTEINEPLCVPNIHFELCEEIDLNETTFSNIDSGDSTQKYIHYNPSVRLSTIPKLTDGSCGIHLSKSKWDPYPYVSGIDKNSPAECSGIKLGDCVLEVCNNNKTKK